MRGHAILVAVGHAGLRRCGTSGARRALDADPPHRHSEITATRSNAPLQNGLYAQDTDRDLAPTIFRARSAARRRSFTCREEAAPMRSQLLPGEASRRRADEQFKTPRKSAPRLRLISLHGKLKWRKSRVCARSGWPRKQSTRILQIATRLTRRQQRPSDRVGVGAYPIFKLLVRQ